MTQDHVVGGGFVLVVTTNLPPVLAAAHWLGPDAPVTNETALIVALLTGVFYALRWAFVRAPREVPSQGALKAAPAPRPAELPQTQAAPAPAELP